VRRARNLGVGGAALCALAALFATPALYMPGLALLLAAVVAPAWVRLSAVRATVTLRPAATTVHEGERVRVTVTVRRGLIPFPGVTLLPWPGASPIALPSRRRGEVALSAVAQRRGRQTLGPARLRVADPLGICVRECLSETHELLVLPRVHPVTAPGLGRLNSQGRARLRAPREATLEVDSLRSYTAGAPASRIHWPTVARTGILMERGFTAEADPRVLVILDAHRPESDEALDQALRAAASLCVHLARRGGCELLLPDDRRASVIGPDLRSWPALHARLALVAPAVGARRGTQPARARTVLYVTASAAAVPALGGRCCRVSPRPLAGVGVAFTVAGCSAQLVSGGERAGSA
jgi:uncharacterized protein (DUF58 family)